MTLEQLKVQLQNAPQTVEFDQVQAVIAAYYDYQPSTFRNGLGEQQITNQAGSNEGSCRIFAFAHLQQLDEAQTLACFGHFYRDHVLGNPQGDDHANIRTFMRHGWAGIEFDSLPLQPRQ